MSQSPVGGQKPSLYAGGQYWVQSSSTCSSMVWVLGQSVPSAGLLMTPNWEEWLVHQRVVVQPRESLTGWNNGLAGASCNSTRIKVWKVLHVGRNNPVNQKGCLPGGGVCRTGLCWGATR